MANSIAKLPAHRSKIEEVLHGHGHAQWLINAAYQFANPDQLFNINYWVQLNLATPIDSGRGTAWYVDAAPHSLVLRQFHRGGAVRRILGNRYFYLGASQTRSFSEFRLLSYLWHQGLPVPEPIGARYERHGLIYRAQLITRRIPQALSWSNLLLNLSPEQQPWKQIGKTIALFHHFGASHADLNAHNILVDQENNEVYLIDFDKGTLKPAGDEKWRMENLARLHRSINKIVPDANQAATVSDGWRHLVDSYSEHFLTCSEPAIGQ